MKRVWVVLLALTACGYGTSVNGKYQARNPITIGTQPVDIYIEIVAAQYGPEVGGLVRLYADKDYISPLTGKECNCVPLKNGGVTNGRFSFSFDLPGTCVDDAAKTDLSFIGKDFVVAPTTLTGVITTKGTSCSQSDCKIVLEKVKKIKELTLEDKQCL